MELFSINNLSLDSIKPLNFMMYHNNHGTLLSNQLAIKLSIKRGYLFV